MVAVVYLLHFDKPGWETAPGRQARHYLGYTTRELQVRLSEHRNGRGSKLVAYWQNHGASFEVAYTEELENKFDARSREIRLKKNGHYSRLCKFCSGGISKEDDLKSQCSRCGSWCGDCEDDGPCCKNHPEKGEYSTQKETMRCTS